MFTLPLKNAEGNFTRDMQILEKSTTKWHSVQMGRGTGLQTKLQPGQPQQNFCQNSEPESICGNEFEAYF